MRRRILPVLIWVLGTHLLLTALAGYETHDELCTRVLLEGLAGCCIYLIDITKERA